MSRTSRLAPAMLALAALLAVSAVAASPATPDYVRALEKAYGAPSQAAFGSAVFYEAQAEGDLTRAALGHYKHFVGKLWEQYGEAAWMGPWQEVYARKPGTEANVVAELRAISDTAAKLSVSMILDVVEGPEAARAALATAFDAAEVDEFRVFNIGDGGAMSGLVIAGRRGAGGEATFLVFLLD